MQPIPAVSINQHTSTTHNNTERRTTHWGAFLGMGVAEVVLGLITLILGAVAVATNKFYGLSYISAGIWGGFAVMSLGICGVCAGGMKNHGLLTASMIVGILVAIVAFAAMCIESAAASWLSVNIILNFGFTLPTAYYCHAVNSTLLFVSFVLAIVHSSMTCCCNGNVSSSPQQGQVIVTTTTHQPAIVYQNSGAMGGEYNGPAPYGAPALSYGGAQPIQYAAPPTQYKQPPEANHN